MVNKLYALRQEVSQILKITNAVSISEGDLDLNTTEYVFEIYCQMFCIFSLAFVLFTHFNL